MLNSDETQAATPESPADFVKKWLNKIDLARKEEKDWRKDSQDILDIYVPPAGKKANSFNILYSNTDIMLPSLYSQTPKADVRRRYSDKDPVGKIASIALERCLDYQIDSYDFDHEMECAVLDALLPGRGLVRLRYEPQTIQLQSAMGMSYEQLQNEFATCEYVKWSDFARSPGKVWSDVTWVGFRHLPDKVEARRWFGELADKLKYDFVANDMGNGDSQNQDSATDAEKADKRAEIWEIWDKTNKEVIFISAGLKEQWLKRGPDPLRLKNFYPLPRPLQFMLKTNSLIPTPDYKQYERQAQELITISTRIIYITRALKIRGVYDASMTELSRLFDSEDNEMIPAENVAGFYEKGGIEKMVWFMPIQEAANVLRELYAQRENAKQAVYDISGISDVMRGQTKASETLGAQELKANFGSVRLRRRQRELQRFIRDIIRLKAEIIAEHFQPETIAKIANLTPEDLQQVAPAQPEGAEQAPMPAPSIDPAEIVALLQSQELRDYRIGIQTDSTLAMEDKETQESMAAFLQGMNQFFAMITPAVEAGWLPIDAAKKLLSSVSRKFKMGEDFEQALESMREPPAKADPEIEVKKADLQLKDKKITGDLELGNKELAIKAAEAASNHINTTHKVMNEHIQGERETSKQGGVPQGL